MESGIITDSGSHSSNWQVLGSKFPKTEVVFFTQVFLIYGVVITSLINISLGKTEELWIVLLTSCLGYLLPNPTLKREPSIIHRPLQ